MNPLWFLRLSKWARRPPSKQRAVLIVVVLVLCGVLYGIEQIWGFPDGFKPDRLLRGRILR